MKLATLIFSLLISLSSFSSTHELPFTKNGIEAKEVSWNKPLLINFMKLYHKVNFEKRMIAGTLEKENKTSYLDELRSKLKGVNGQFRL